jgi:hypothetical protein
VEDVGTPAGVVVGSGDGKFGGGVKFGNGIPGKGIDGLALGGFTWEDLSSGERSLALSNPFTKAQEPQSAKQATKTPTTIIVAGFSQIG